MNFPTNYDFFSEKFTLKWMNSPTTFSEKLTFQMDEFSDNFFRKTHFHMDEFSDNFFRKTHFQMNESSNNFLEENTYTLWCIQNLMSKKWTKKKMQFWTIFINPYSIGKWSCSTSKNYLFIKVQWTISVI